MSTRWCSAQRGRCMITMCRQHRQHHPTQGQAYGQKQLHAPRVSVHSWKACQAAEKAASRADAWPLAWAREYTGTCLAYRWQDVAPLALLIRQEDCFTCHNDCLDQQPGLQIELVDPLQRALPPGVQEGTQHAVDPDISVQGRPEVPLCTPGRHQLSQVLTTGGRGEISLQSCCNSECLHCCIAALNHGCKHAHLPQPQADVQADNRSKQIPDRHHTRAGMSKIVARWLESRH